MRRAKISKAPRKRDIGGVSTGTGDGLQRGGRWGNTDARGGRNCPNCHAEVLRSIRAPRAIGTDASEYLSMTSGGGDWLFSAGCMRESSQQIPFVRQRLG